SQSISRGEWGAELSSSLSTGGVHFKCGRYFARNNEIKPPICCPNVSIERKLASAIRNRLAIRLALVLTCRTSNYLHGCVVMARVGVPAGLVLAILVLAGCSSAIQRVDLGEWRQYLAKDPYTGDDVPRPRKVASPAAAPAIATVPRSP